MNKINLMFVVFMQLISMSSFSQIPSISFIDPAYGKAGDIITIHGSNFSNLTANIIVFFGPVKAEVVSASSVNLKVIVPQGASSYSPVNVISNSLVASSLTSATSHFNTRYNNGVINNETYKEFSIPVGDFPTDLTSGDFNGDGRPDIATCDFFSRNLFIILRKTDNTGFEEAVAYPFSTVFASTCIDIGTDDFNNDGNLDIYVVSRDNQTVFVFTGNGDGTFITPPTKVYIENYPRRVITADINGDGKKDLITGNLYTSFNVVLGNGAGGFGIPIKYNLPVNDVSITSGDFNKDGKVDLATIDFPNRFTVFLRNAANDGFDSSSVIVGAGFIINMTSADFNNDATLDIILADFNSDQIWMLKGKGDGTFNTPVSFPVSNPMELSSGDINGDGNIDLLITCYNTELKIWLGDGSGSFMQEIPFQLGYSLGGNIISDFNADGIVDIAVTDQISRVFLFENKFTQPPTSHDITERKIPNLITPNKDGMNETFNIGENNNLKKLKIFSRWGDEIYNNVNYKNDWDGNGASDGLYFYVLIFPDTLEEYKGWIQILR